MTKAEVDKANREFKGYERIQRFIIDGEELSAANGMLTQTMKLKRRGIVTRYAEVIEAMYAGGGTEITAAPEPAVAT